MDEPTVGMDIQSRISMWEMMKQIRSDFETTIFLTTHYLEEADSLSNNVCIMKEGKAVKQGTPTELRSLLQENTIRLQFHNIEDAKEYIGVLKDFLRQEKMIVQNSTVIIHSPNAQSDMEYIISFLAERHTPFQGIEIAQPTLEDVFLRLTQSRQGECI